MSPTLTLTMALCTLAARPATSGGGLPACLHAQANINDPLSHGSLGDNLLSLNEAILLHNGQLLLSQLSPAEAGQVSGFSADISEITIDAAAVPWITVQQDLEPIVDSPHGLLIEGANGRPVIDLTNSNVHFGFRAANNLCSWRNLVLLGGTFAIDLQQTDASFGGTVVDNVVFDGQSQFAFRTAGTSTNGISRVFADQCTFRNTPRAIIVDEAPAGRSSVFALFHTEVAAAIEAITLTFGSGGQAILQFDSLRIDCPGNGLRVLRYAGSDRPLQIASTHLRITAANCLEVQGTASAPSSLTLRMLEIAATNGGSSGSALNLWPLGADFTGTIEDSRIRGDCTVLTGGGSQGLLVDNCRMRLGAALLGSSSLQPLDLVQVAFEQCAVATAGVSPLQPFGCTFHGGSLQGTAAAPVQTSFCHVAVIPGAYVAQSSPLPSSPLAAFDLTPPDPAVGTTVTIAADFPQGLYGIFAIGPTTDTPTILAQPMHVYFDVQQAIFLPGVCRLHDSVPVQIPPLPVLVGTDWICHAAVAADPGMLAPDLQLPPAQRVVLR